jgi:hypothetical protein
LLGLLFYPDNGSDMLLRNVWLSELHGVTTQKAILFTVMAVRTSDPTNETSFVSNYWTSAY